MLQHSISMKFQHSISKSSNTVFLKVPIRYFYKVATPYFYNVAKRTQVNPRPLPPLSLPLSQLADRPSQLKVSLHLTCSHLTRFTEKNSRKIFLHTFYSINICSAQLHRVLGPLPWGSHRVLLLPKALSYKVGNIQQNLISDILYSSIT